MVFEPLLDVVAAPMGDVAEPRGRGQLLVAFQFLDVMNALAQVCGKLLDGPERRVWLGHRPRIGSR